MKLPATRTRRFGAAAWVRAAAVSLALLSTAHSGERPATTPAEGQGGNADRTLDESDARARHHRTVARKARADARRARARAEQARAKAEAAARAAGLPSPGAEPARKVVAPARPAPPVARTRPKARPVASRAKTSNKPTAARDRTVTAPSAVPAAAQAAPTPIAAEVAEQRPAPGTLINAESWPEYADMGGPGLAWAVARGVSFEVAPYRKIRPRPAFVAATERYSGQVRLSADSTQLIDHVAGLPFPAIDSDDPQAGARHMFNYDATIAHDDATIRAIECDTGTIGRNGQPVKVERTFLVGQLRRLYYRERLAVAPVPEMPNPEGIRYREALYPVQEPFDLAGVAFTANRYIDPARQDDGWLYIPTTRRTRRISSSQRSDARFGQDTDPDSYAGWAGNVAWVNWRLVGEKTMLAPMHTESIPVTWQEPSGDFMHRGDWEPRQAWVIEGVSKLPDYSYSRRVIYIDKESYHILYSEMYDNDGQLWKVWFNAYHYASTPRPDAGYGLPYEALYFPSISMVDLQAEHVTHCSLPSSRYPSEQGWYIDAGSAEGTVEEAFSLSAMIAAGR